MNNITLTGRLTKDIELKTLNSGSKVASFCLASDRRQKDGKVTDFIDCVAWGKTAEVLAQWVKKGNLIGVVGTLQTRQYDDSNGNKRKATEVVVDRVEFFGGQQETKKEAPAPAPEPTVAEVIEEVAGELPFEI